TGKLMSVPPPASALNTPAAIAARPASARSITFTIRFLSALALCRWDDLTRPLACAALPERPALTCRDQYRPDVLRCSPSTRRRASLRALQDACTRSK